MKKKTVLMQGNFSMSMDLGHVSAEALGEKEHAIILRLPGLEHPVIVDAGQELVFSIEKRKTPGPYGFFQILIRD
jgi:hypothetical protein